MNTQMRIGFRVLVILSIVCANLLLLPTSALADEGGVIGSEPASHNFGDAVVEVQIVNQVFRINNLGTSDLVVQNLSIAGADAADFWLGPVEWPFTLAPGQGQGVVVSFSPSSTGPKSAALRVESSAQNGSPFDIPLTGNGVGIETLGSITASSVPMVSTALPGRFITVPIRIDASGAVAPGDLIQSYQATLSWDPSVLLYQGYKLGDSPWGIPASIGATSSSVDFFDVVSSGVGGSFTVIRLLFKVIGPSGSTTGLDLQFSRLEGSAVENLLPILTVQSGNIRVGGRTSPPDIDVSPSSYDYGAVPLGESASKTFLVRNTGQSDLNVQSTTLSGINPDQYSIDSGGGAFTLAAGQSREVVVSFNPSAQGTMRSSLLIRSNDPDEFFYYVSLTGSVSVPDIAVNPTSFDFGDAGLGTLKSMTLVISNEGTAPLYISQFGLDDHQNQFSYSFGVLAILFPGESGEVTMQFHPTTVGEKNATFVIHSNDPDEVAVEVPLRGNGISN